MASVRHLSARFRRRLRDPRRRGVIIILAAFLIQAMFAFAAFAVDLGYIVLTSQQLQNAADAAALAAVLELKSAGGEDDADTLKQRALAEAIYAASLNRAALRPVVIGASDVRFGNRTYNVDAGRFQTDYDGDLDTINSVDVTIRYDGDSKPIHGDDDDDDWSPRSGREKLALFFGRVIQVNDTVVSGDSRAHLTPRDLVFCIDISGSMFGQSGGNTPTNATSIAPLMFSPIYGTNTSSYPQQWYDMLYKGNYKRLWEEAMVNGTFGTATQVTAFLAQEFPDRNPTTPWTHWKWRAFCDWNYASSGGGFNTLASARIYNGNGETRNLNVSMTATRLQSRPGGTTPKKNPTTATSWSELGGLFGPLHYTTFLTWNGYVPCVRGQTYYPRDMNQDLVLDNPSDVISQSVSAPYPTSIVYYPRVRDIEGFNRSLLGSGDSFTGIYPNSVDARPMSIVRQATLFGLNAMIEAEQQGNAEIVFNQVGMVSFGTYAHPDLDLTNQLNVALRTGASRLTTYPGNPHITPHASGATNIGMGIRYSVRMLTDPNGRGRSFANKSIALLTDGEPNYSPAPAGNYEANEFVGNNQNLTGPDTNRGRAYAEYWADKCAEMDIQLHCIGLNLNSTTQAFLEGVAERGGGIFEHIVDAQAQRDDLINIFVLIAKDKLGKLYLD